MRKREAILNTTVNNSVLQGNQEWESSGGKNTQDHVFLLSYQEVMRYFGSPEDRICTPTPYAIEIGADTREYSGHITEAGWWWLRSPGEKEHHAAFVNFDGNCYSNAVGNEYLSVRPAMWVDLDVLSTLDYEILEDEESLLADVADAIRERLPIVTYAMADDGEVYSYGSELLYAKTDWFYFYSRTNEIVITDVSKDGRALYVRYPSTTSETGYRERWFAIGDILGSITPNVYSQKMNTKTSTYRIEYGTTLTEYNTIPKGEIYTILGDVTSGGRFVSYPMTGCRLAIYPLSSSQMVLGVKAIEQMALIRY